MLIALYHLNQGIRLCPSDPVFQKSFKTAMVVYTQRAFKLDPDFPLTCSTFANYFLVRRSWNAMENLTRKAIELTDVNAIASDGWFLLARKEHNQEKPNWNKAADFYNRADNARGGGDRGYLPARFGAAQMQVLNNDIGGAKFRLEKMIQYSKSIEAMTLLGTLYAQEVFASQSSGAKDDKSAESKKAIALLEAVRLAWKDGKRNIQPDSGILISLAQLYEVEQPEKALQCLQQVQQRLMDRLPEAYLYVDVEDEKARLSKRREHMPAALLNNIGCFQFQLERYEEASDTFQTALTAVVKEKQDSAEEQVDSDALVTTISYNLGRSYDGAGLLDEARQIYDGLLARHADYPDARARMAYIELRQNPTVDGPKAMAALYEAESSNLEVRSLYGWYLSKAKKRVSNIAEDQEQRHYKHTLQNHDKHDQYSLTGMGNLYLTLAREMRRDTEPDREKRRKTYEKAVEFYVKALQLDGRNAYAAQGIGIALAEDRKEFTSAVQIFSKVKDTIKDSSVFINLGHVYAELKQYSRAIESVSQAKPRRPVDRWLISLQFESALAKDRGSDPQVLACLGRVWLLKGKHEKSAVAMKQSLEYSHKALAIAPDQIHFQFNIAFVQIQLAQLLHTLPDNLRTLEEVEAAARGLDAAIESFGEIAKAKNPPYPRHDLEQRANMGRNTMRRQLERAVQQQKEYEETNAAKLARAKAVREAELKAREDAKQKAEQEAEERKRKLMEERQQMLEVSRLLAEKRAEEERRREEAEFTVDSEGERVKRRRKAKGGGKRKKKGEEDSEGRSGTGESPAPRRKARRKSTDDGGSGDSGAGKAPRKRRKLARKHANAKIKSSEMVVDSDSDGGGGGATQANGASGGAFDPNDSDDDGDGGGSARAGDVEMPDAHGGEAGDDEARDTATVRPRTKVSRRIDDEDEDEDADEASANGRRRGTSASDDE
jgi:RNA polymerase-associated protein CTR9